MNRPTATILTAFALCLLALPAFGGWIETDRDGSRTVFSDGKIKDEGSDGTWNVFDTRTGQLTLVDDERKIFTREKIDSFCRAIKTAADQAMSRMSPEERKMMEQMTGSSAGKQGDAKKPTVSVSPLGTGGKVAGFDTEKYQVKVNGKLYEEVWIAPAAPVLKELDLRGLQKYQKDMSGCLQHAGPLGFPGGTAPEESREYETLLSKGWVMRSVQYDQGAASTTTEVGRLEKRDIPASEFLPPSGYRQVSVDKFMTGE